MWPYFMEAAFHAAQKWMNESKIAPFGEKWKWEELLEDIHFIISMAPLVVSGNCSINFALILEQFYLS